MRHGEYERRRRTLEKQYDDDRELLRAAHEAKLRSLETLWLGSPMAAEVAIAEQVPSVGGDPRQEERETERPVPNGTQAGETQVRSETQSPDETQNLNDTQAQTGTQAEVRSVPRGGLREAIEEVLPQLPEVFNRHELEKALGFAPARSSVVRILQEMWVDQVLTIEEYSEGRRPTRYRKVAGPA